MATRTLPRVRLYHEQPTHFSSMPTCGVCKTQIKQDETYAGVLHTASDSLTGRTLRETRHNVDFCLRYEYGPALVLRPGALVHSHRYTLTDWGGTIPAVVVERTDEFNEFGWRGYVVKPESPELAEKVIERFRTHREASFRKMAETAAVEPEGRMVFISDEEWTHYVLPS